jgi:uncharacterized protein YkwD
MITRFLALLLFMAIAASGGTYLHAQRSSAINKTPANKKPINKAPANKAPVKTSGPKTNDDSSFNSALRLLSTREKQLFDEINLARGNPDVYIKVLEAFRKSYRGKEIHFPEGRVLVTNEGVEALDDAIKFLREVKPLPPFELRAGMVQAARVHANDLASSDKSGHRGSDGSKPDDRISRFGTWDGSVGENIVYDSSTARYDVIGMIIDDGTSNRGHRENLFSEDFQVIGIAIGKRANGSSFGVVTFADEFRDKQ